VKSTAGGASKAWRNQLGSKSHFFGSFSGGSFRFAWPEACGSWLSFRRWEEVAADDELRARVKWAKVKSARRAVEKVYRCYELDPSRLLDVCRQVPHSY
jgi:hypothetical protein